MAKTLDIEDKVYGPNDYDPKQKYVTVTSINHGRGAEEPLIVPPDAEFSKYAGEFDEDELNAFVAQGSIVPLSDVNSDISDENDALKAELEASEAEKQQLADDKDALAKQVADLNAQLEAAKKSAVPPTK